MIDCLFRLDFVLPYLLKCIAVSFFHETRTSAFFAVLFSFQRTIALSDLITLSRHFSFVKQIFLCFFRAVYRLPDGGYYPIILFLFCQAVFSDFIGIFVSAHTYFLFFCIYSHLPLPMAPPPP